MLDYSALLYIVLILPALGGGLCLLLRSPAFILTVVLATTMATAMSAITAAAGVWTSGPVSALGGWLYLDALSAWHILVMMIVFMLASTYAQSYFRASLEAREFPRRAAQRFGALWLGALCTMTLVLVSNNLGILWVGVEGTTLLTAFLICIHRTKVALEAMWKYLIICSVGVAFAFMGTLLVGAAAEQLHLSPAQSLLWTELNANAAGLNPVLLKAAFLFLLVGYGTKAGLAPMHNWLPDAHSQAPAPVSALFSGFMLNAALYGILRYVPLVEGASGGTGWCLRLLAFFGVLSILVSAAFLYFQRDVKRLLAYSTVEHLGIIALGVGLGGAGAIAALFHMLNHSLGKSVAFFSAGRVGQIYGTHDIKKLSGALRTVPVWGAGLFVSLLALIGMAPFSVFLSEFQIALAAAQSRAWWSLGLFLLGISVIFMSALRHGLSLAWGAPGETVPVGNKATAVDAVLVWLPLGVLLVLGLWMPPFLYQAMSQAAAVIGGAR